jgi:prepilin-type N-terminal cleavage/methylation domain-containing protein
MRLFRNRLFWNSQSARKSYKPIRGFTLIELLVVIAIIGALAGLTVGLAGLASTKMKLSRVRGELEKLTSAIESFKASYGVYPPDNHSSNLKDRSIPNPLFYELVGTIYNPTTRTFQSPMNSRVLNVSDIQSIFGIDGFVNSGDSVKNLKNFLTDIKPTEVGVYSLPNGKKVDVLIVPVLAPNSKKGDINQWHYISTNPTNNPNSFDLWAEIQIGKKSYIIGNWKD